jgi:hypothetical protein
MSWGVPAFSSTRSIAQMSNHPLFLCQAKASMEMMNIRLSVQNSQGNLDQIYEVIETFEMSYLPDHTSSSYRTKSRKRVVVKSTRLIEIKKYLKQGLPNFIATGDVNDL